MLFFSTVPRWCYHARHVAQRNSDKTGCKWACQEPVPAARGVIANFLAFVATVADVDVANAPMGCYIDRHQHGRCRRNSLNKQSRFEGGYRNKKKYCIWKSQMLVSQPPVKRANECPQEQQTSQSSYGSIQ